MEGWMPSSLIPPWKSLENAFWIVKKAYWIWSKKEEEKDVLTCVTLWSMKLAAAKEMDRNFSRHPLFRYSRGWARDSHMGKISFPLTLRRSIYKVVPLLLSLSLRDCPPKIGSMIVGQPQNLTCTIRQEILHIVKWYITSGFLRRISAMSQNFARFRARWMSAKGLVSPSKKSVTCPNIGHMPLKFGGHIEEIGRWYCVKKKGLTLSISHQSSMSGFWMAYNK